MGHAHAEEHRQAAANEGPAREKTNVATGRMQGLAMVVAPLR